MDTSLTKLLTMVQVSDVRGFRRIPPLEDSLISGCATTHLREDDPNSPEVLAEDVVVLSEEGAIF